MDGKGLFKKVLGILSAFALALFGFLFGRHSGKSSRDDRASDIHRIGESVGTAADSVADAAGESAELADDAGKLADSAGYAAESVENLTGRLHDAQKLLVLLESQSGTDINRIERIRELIAELKRRYEEASRQSQNP